MSLSTINSSDSKIKQFKQWDTARDWSVNLYNLDIEGSSPRRYGALNQKIDYTNKNDDIDRSSPKPLYSMTNKEEFNIKNSDIEFSMPNCVKIKTNRRVNPLEPKYQLPQSENYPPEIPKFIRDNIQVNDIAGTQCKKIMSKWQGRSSLKNDDIEKCSPRKPYLRQNISPYVYNFIDYNDVTRDEFKTGRMTNPLEPMYRLGYVTGEKVKIGPIDGNKPVVFSKYTYPDPFNLRNNDINGSSAGTKNTINKFTGMNFMYTSNDIYGAQKDTRKKGIVTNRHLNPLVPKYPYLGEKELQNSKCFENDPFNKGKANITLSKLPIENNWNKKRSVTTIGGKKSEMISQKETPTKNQEKIKDKENKKVNGNERLDLENVPYVEDNVVFDRDRYKKPSPFYGFVHDKYIIPPVEGYKKQISNNNIDINSNVSNGMTGSIKATNSLTKSKIGLTKSISGSDTIKNITANNISFPRQTYAEKLDNFMVSNNWKFIEDSQVQKIKPSPTKNDEEVVGGDTATKIAA